MSEGIIVANLGGAKYSVQFVYDLTGWQQRWDSTVASIASADAKIVEHQAALNTALVNLNNARNQLNSAIITSGDYQAASDTVAAANIAYVKARRANSGGVAAKADALSMQQFLVSVKPDVNIVVDIYCADYDDTLVVGTRVGLLEINNRTVDKKSYTIHPNNTHIIDIGGSVYDHARDGSMEPVSSNVSPSNWALNYALFIGWQRFQPLYRLGVVDVVYPANATASGITEVDVTLDAAYSTQTPEGHVININRTDANTADMLQTMGIPVWYMDNGGTASVGDTAVLLYFAQNLSDAKVIGLSAGGIPLDHRGGSGLIYAALSDVVASSEAGVNNIGIYDSVRSISYRISSSDVIATHFHSTGAVTATSFPWPKPADSAGTSWTVFVTPTGLAVYGGGTLDVALGAAGTAPVITVGSGVSIGDKDYPLQAFVDPGASGYPNGTGWNEFTPIMEWVQTGPTEYKRIVRRLSLSAWDDGFGGVLPPLSTVDPWGLLSDGLGSWQYQVTDGITSSFISITADALVEQRQAAAGYDANGVAHLLGVTGSVKTEPAYTDWLTSAAGIAAIDLLFISLTKGTPYLSANEPTTWEGFDPLLTYFFQSDEKAVLSGGFTSPANIIAQNREGGNVGQRRPTVWLHEPSGSGTYVTTEVPSGVMFTKAYPAGSSGVPPFYKWFLVAGGGVTATNVSRYPTTVDPADIWRLLGRAPLANPTLPNPAP